MVDCIQARQASPSTGSSTRRHRPSLSSTWPTAAMSCMASSARGARPHPYWSRVSRSMWPPLFRPRNPMLDSQDLTWCRACIPEMDCLARRHARKRASPGTRNLECPRIARHAQSGSSHRYLAKAASRPPASLPAKVAKVASQHDGDLRAAPGTRANLRIDVTHLLNWLCVLGGSPAVAKIAKQAWRSSRRWRTSIPEQRMGSEAKSGA
jgi:hypothetical protein